MSPLLRHNLIATVLRAWESDVLESVGAELDEYFGEDADVERSVWLRELDEIQSVAGHLSGYVSLLSPEVREEAEEAIERRCVELAGSQGAQDEAEELGVGIADVFGVPTAHAGVRLGSAPGDVWP